MSTEIIKIGTHELCVCNPGEDTHKYFPEYFKAQPNFAGTCRGYFRNGQFDNTWLDVNDGLYDCIRDDVRSLMEEFLEEGPLRSPQNLQQFCDSHPDARLEGSRPFYGFISDTELCRYEVMLNTTPGDYCIYVRCFVK